MVTGTKKLSGRKTSKKKYGDGSGSGSDSDSDSSSSSASSESDEEDVDVVPVVLDDDDPKKVHQDQRLALIESLTPLVKYAR